MPSCPDPGKCKEHFGEELILEKLTVYGPVRLLNIEADQPAGWPAGQATHLRVSLPAAYENMRPMLEQGFVFADRMLDVSIIPARTKLDYAKMVRLAPELTSGHKEELLSIAKRSFTTDRRFHVAPAYDDNLAGLILEAWITELPDALVCRYRDAIAGFLALRPSTDKQTAIHLAAVLEKYRSAGVALSLYAGAICQAMQNGIEVITGYISAANTPVVNLYAHLGGTFSNPRDIFLKEVHRVHAA